MPRCFVKARKYIAPNDILYIDYGAGYSSEHFKFFKKSEYMEFRDIVKNIIDDVIDKYHTKKKKK